MGATSTGDGHDPRRCDDSAASDGQRVVQRSNEQRGRRGHRRSIRTRFRRASVWQRPKNRHQKSGDESHPRRGSVRPTAHCHARITRHAGRGGQRQRRRSWPTGTCGPRGRPRLPWPVPRKRTSIPMSTALPPTGPAVEGPGPLQERLDAEANAPQLALGQVAGVVSTLSVRVRRLAGTRRLHPGRIDDPIAGLAAD